MHLGRTPSRLPPELAAQARRFGPAIAWERTVEAAVEAGVRAVLLAGDVVDRDDDFFEAYGQLARGVKRLAVADIDVIGVAGNHDVKVLPRLASEIPAFRLLGSGGEWEYCEIADGRESVIIWGWSFPRARVLQSPLPDAPFKRRPGVNLGLLHCDRDAGASPYAPVTGSELKRAGLDGWLLGHIHVPDELTAASANGYLGSLTGLHRGEIGARGPWLIGVSRGSIAEVEHLPLAPLRWQRLDVDLEGISEPVEAKGRLLKTLRAFDEELANTAHSPDAVGLGIRLCGRSRFGAAAVGEFSDEDRERIDIGTGSIHYFIESISAETRPEIDLEKLAVRGDPPGLLAQRLLWLAEPEGHEERERLVALARHRLRSESRNSRWSGLGEPLDADPAEWLRNAGYRALETLLAQSPEQG
ncbi:MAG: DNA repair exonuclease [Proteobacteria bacterium]|nr:DNA repair exonuclease [Pseudomonadota bacterium]